MRKGLLALLTCTAAFAAPGDARAETTIAGHARVAIGSAAATADYSRTPERQRFVILQEWQRSRMRELKAVNPALRVLVYKNLSFMAARDPWGNASTGVTTQEAADGWYLRNTGGERFTSWSYNWLWAADVGDPAYQRQWADNVLAILTQQGWDGVFVDDANPTMRHHYTVASVAKYPSDAAYSAATGSALATIGPRLRAAGKLVIPNFGSWRTYRPTVESWLPYVSGGMEEQFTKWGNSPDVGHFTGPDWEQNLASLKAAQALGKEFIGIAHSANTDAAAARYGWATLLLGADGRASFALHGDYTNEPWFPEYDYDLGAPAGAESRLPSGVHRRPFTRGLVVVNPTPDRVPVSFGAPHSGSGLAGATSATLGPHSALVLVRDDAATAPPAADDPPPPEPTAPPAADDPPPPEPTAAGDDPRPRPRRPRLRAALRRGRVVARLTCRSTGRPCRHRVVVGLPAGGHTVAVGARRAHVRAGGTRRLRIPIAARGRRALRRGRSLQVLLRPGGVRVRLAA